MPPIVLGEYRNQHEQRMYPFLDDATLKDATGWVLPTNFIIDAFLYPIDLENALYLSSIDTGKSKLYFSDTVTGKIHGVAVLGADETAYVYEPDGMERQIGIVTFGSGKMSGLQGQELRVFTPAATELVPTAYIALNQEGVRAIKIPDGTTVTGPVKFRGTDGVNVKSYYGEGADAGKHILEFEILGLLPPLPEDCGDCGFIREICIDRQPGSMFTVSEFDYGTLAISAHELFLDDICEAQRCLRLPSEEGNLSPCGDDACEDPLPPEVPTPPGPEITICYDVTTLGGNFFIVTPSLVGEWNPVHLTPMYDIGFQGSPRLRPPLQPVDSYKDLDGLVEQFRDPPDLGDALKIGFKGLMQFRRKQHA